METIRLSSLRDCILIDGVGSPNIITAKFIDLKPKSDEAVRVRGVSRKGLDHIEIAPVLGVLSYI